MKLIIYIDSIHQAVVENKWKRTLSQLLPQHQIYLWNENTFKKDEIDYAFVFRPPKNMISSLKNIQAVFSLSADVSHVLGLSDHPKHVPVIRLTSENQQKRMCEYILLHVLSIHRQLLKILQDAKKATWFPFHAPLASERKIGIMGMGYFGFAVAKMLKSIGFNVIGLARHEKIIDGIFVHSIIHLEKFLENLDVVISLLPLTKETHHIVSKKFISYLPSHAWIINAGRGPHINDNDLIEALDNNQIEGAILDVFDDEPLPKNHPFWRHPKIVVTSHTAAPVYMRDDANIIATNILRYIDGERWSDCIYP